MKRRAAVMSAPGRIEVCREEIPEPAPDGVIVHTDASAISAGTELMLYRGQGPADMPLDASLTALSGNIQFPLRYGYAAVGEVVSGGPQVPSSQIGRRVFCFHPHASHLAAAGADVIPIPEDISNRDALFLAAMETAVTLVLDGRPAIGERAVVFGQGVVGLLVTALLSRHPIGDLAGIDPSERRRRAAMEAGAGIAADPEKLTDLTARWTAGTEGDLADLVYELSGNPLALNQAIGIAGFGARVVIGSWYGSKPSSVDLGGRFHRSRIRMISSQVSTLPPGLTGRWTKARRIAVAWEMIRRIAPSRWISHEFPVEDAARAYELLDSGAEDVLQVILTYR